MRPTITKMHWEQAKHQRLITFEWRLRTQLAKHID